jgi:membrane protein GlpM
MIILMKALLGAALLVGLHYLTKTRNYYLAHLALSCPILSVFAHYFIGTERNAIALKQTLLFGMFALLPFLIYLVALYLSAGRVKLITALTLASVAWLISATALTILWEKPTP